MQLLQLSEATAAQRRVFFHIVDATDGITAETGLTGVGRLSKNGAATAATTASLVEVDVTNMPGRYYMEFTAAELDTLGIIEFRYKAAACAEVVARAQVVPFDPYSAADLGLTTLASRASQASVDTVDDFLDTEIAAIKAKTDGLPADPADASDIAGSFTTVNTKLDTIDDFLDTEVAAIKAKTDQLTFTAANKVDASLQAAGDLVAAVANKIADHTLRRTYANARGSSDGDAVNFRSLLGAIGKLVNKWAISGATLTVYQEDDVTATAPGGTQAITSDAAADPITTLDTT
jgi:hypothetical protein